MATRTKSAINAERLRNLVKARAAKKRGAKKSVRKAKPKARTARKPAKLVRRKAKPKAKRASTAVTARKRGMSYAPLSKVKVTTQTARLLSSLMVGHHAKQLRNSAGKVTHTVVQDSRKRTIFSMRHGVA